jgi:chloramphenicol 3-O-phosphotransferase
MATAQQPGVWLLVGLPGTGKYSVAVALQRLLDQQGQVARIVDNHYLANPVLALTAQDGVTPLPAAVWEKVALVTEAVLDTVERLSPRAWSFIFTADIADGNDEAALLPCLARVAAARDGRLNVVRLTCAIPELRRRIVQPERRQRLKSVSVLDVESRQNEGVPPLTSWSPVTIDTTDLAPDQVAASILRLLSDRR